ncbi:MAG: hypothetical protein WC343_12870, partial [Bacilli bacterium]
VGDAGDVLESRTVFVRAVHRPPLPPGKECRLGCLQDVALDIVHRAGVAERPGDVEDSHYNPLPSLVLRT